MHSSRSAGPSSITLPPPPVFSSFSLQGYPPDPPTVETPSPTLVFKTAPSSPHSEPPSPVSPPVQWYTPPTTPQNDLLETAPQQHHAAPLHHPPDSVPHTGPIAVPLAQREQPTAGERTESPDDAFPSIVDLALDSGFDEDNLSTLEKIYLYARSESPILRTFIAHALPSYLDQVTPQDAHEYVLPLIHALAVDEEESVKAALAKELVPVIWWFFSHCQLIPEDLQGRSPYASTSTMVTISVQSFTPILGTLLLGTSEKIITPAKFAVLDMLNRMRRADAREAGVSPSPSSSNTQANIAFLSNNLAEDDEDIPYPAVGLFKAEERSLFRQELLHSVIIGMSRLDLDLEYEPMDVDSPAPRANTDQISRTSSKESSPSQQENPYFPSISKSSPTSSTQSSDNTPPTSPSSAGQNALRNEMRASFSPPHSPATHSPNSSGKPNSRRSPPPSPGSEWPEEKPKPQHAWMEHDHKQEYDEAYEVSGNDAGNNARKAALGRLSSMSLMAAVTATGSLEDEFQQAFVRELERVGRDAAYFYVRREASLALGALAKVVPQELVSYSLLPLFDALRWDQDFRVRQSALFALPAILPRLSPNHRRTVALETAVALSKDRYGIVRVGVLEILGEVILTFQNDPGGPPRELLELFLGRPQDSNIRDGTHWGCYNELEPQPAEQAPELFYTDPERPLICAFNFPAITLTLGGEKWPELRGYYLDLARNKNVYVRKTMAASLGEIAAIIGKEAALVDLLPVWWDSLTFDDESVRTKAVEALDKLMPILGSDAAKSLVEGLLRSWEEGSFRGWRERESILFSVEALVKTGGSNIVGPAVRRLVVKGLEDNVAAVRERARSVLPHIWDLFAGEPDLRAGLQADLESFANSPMFRRRMTFIACMQTQAQHLDEHRISIELDGMLRSIARLARDPVVGVRIAVSRFLSVLYAIYGHRVTSAEDFRSSVQALASDPSHDVKSFLLELQNPRPSIPSTTGTQNSSTLPPLSRHSHASLFSRPPVSPLPSPTGDLDAPARAIS